MTEQGQRHYWYRPRNVLLGLLALFLGVVGWVTWETWQVYKAKPNPSTDYRSKFREMIAKQAGSHSRAAADHSWRTFDQAITQAAQVFKTISGRSNEPGWTPRDPDDGGEIDFNRIIRTHPIEPDIAREREVLDLLEQQGTARLRDDLAQSPTALRPSDGAGMIMAELPAFGPVRALAMSRIASMRLAAIAGDEQKFTEAFEHALTISSTAAHQPMVISGIVSASINSLLCDEVSYSLTERAFTDSACRRMLQAVQRHAFPPVQFTLEGERIIFRDFVQHSFSDDGHGNGYMLADTVDPMSSLTMPQMTFLDAAASRFILTDRVETIAKYDEMLDRCIAESMKPRKSWWSSGFDPDVELDRLGRRHVLVGLMLPAIAKSMDNPVADRAKRDGMKLLIAIEAHQAMHGRAPQSVEELLPDLLDSIPEDSISGEPFKYRPLHNDQHGRGFLLYSCGSDGVDNGGQAIEQPGQRWRALTKKAPDVDFVFNMPRPKREPE